MPWVNQQMTKLNPLAESIRTEAFQRWFAGSWFKDDEGKPMVLYHGTRPDTVIDAFELPNDLDGVYFTPDPLYAEGFVSALGTDEGKAGGIYPVYLSVKNPYIVIADPEEDDWLRFIDRGLDRRELQAAGYDGAILIERTTGVVDQVQAYDPAQIKSAIGNTGTFDPTVPDIRYARTDPRYLFAGPQAESSDLQLLDQARLLEKNRITSEIIWRETGWLRGVDGNWRYEISDDDARLTIGIPQAFEDEVLNRVYQEVSFSEDGQLVKASYREGKPDYLAAFGHNQSDAGISLVNHLTRREFKGIASISDIDGQIVEMGDILDHPRLYAAYPRLKEQAVRLDRSMHENDWGEFDWGTGITLNGNLSHGQILGVLLHETQHAIQEAEGFAYGGMPKERFTNRIKDRLKELSIEQQQKVDEWTATHKSLLDAEGNTSDMITYGLMYQSAQRLMSYANRDRPSGVLRLIRNEMGWVFHHKVRQSPSRQAFDDLQRQWCDLPKRHRMQARNHFLREQSAQAADLIRSVIPEPVFQQFRQDQRQLKSVLNALEREASRARQETRPLQQLKKTEETTEALRDRHYFSSTYEIYRALAGEIEARNTETRRGLNETERRNTHPERTADIPADQAIVIFRNKNSFNVEVPFRTTNTVPANFLRQRESTANGLTRNQAQVISDGLMKNWKARPEIVAVNRISELPATLQRDIWGKRAAHDMRAAFWNNTVYLVAPRLPSRQALEEVVLHEVIGHYGLRTLLGPQLEPTLERIYVDMAETSLAEQIKSIYFKEPPFNQDVAEHRQLLAEELMAKLAESGEHRQLTETHRYMADVRSGLRDMGFELPLTHSDLLNLLHGAEQVVRYGGFERPGEFDTCFRRAYHGSPHKFDRFSTQFIGSGEGAISFGWGLYFTDKREVAELYRDNITARMLDTANGRFQAGELMELLGVGSPEGQAITFLVRGQGWDQIASENPELSEAVDYLREEVSIVDEGGSLYEVEIPDESAFLDYDKPFSQQPQGVREKIEAAAVDRGLPLDIDGKPLFLKSDPSGQTVYATIGGIRGERYGSTLLGQSGIPGLRYLDQFSRHSPGNGTYNYVIWDADLVSVQAVSRQREAPKQTNTEAFSAWFDDSKVADDNGEPIVMYHGTASDISAFEVERGGQNTGHPGAALGVYLTRSRQLSNSYAEMAGRDGDGGQNVMPLYVSIRNPKKYDTASQFYRDADNNAGRETDWRSEMEADGYDGIIVRDDFEEVIAFSPKQIKSATGNIGTFDASNQDIRYSRAYHGTPHQFDRFSLEAIGSGEGAAAFGWGLYFAGHREVAEFYRDALAQVPHASMIAGWDVLGASAVAKDLLKGLPMEQAIDFARQREGKMRGLYDDTAEELIRIQGRGHSDTGNNLYEAKIPDDDQLLDWERPLTEQPTSVYRVIRDTGLAEMLGNEPFPVSGQMMSGGDLYDQLTTFLSDRTLEGANRQAKPDNNEAASRYFNAIGIPGLRYRDQFSRQAPGEETHNYVIWDDTLVTIRAVNDELHQATEILNPTETEAFRNWFGHSAVTTQTGEPKTLFHATDADFSAFDVDRTTGVAGAGIYMSEDCPLDTPGGFIMPLYASIQNPADFSSGDKAINDMAETIGLKHLSELSTIPEMREWSKAFRAGMLKQGYDGAMLAGPYGQTYYTAYQAHMVKSATGNTGIFSAHNSDIRYSRGAEYTQPQQIRDAEKTIPLLMEQVAAAYKIKDFLLAEALDEKLEETMDHLEHSLADMEEDGFTQMHFDNAERHVRDSLYAEFTGSADDSEDSLKEILAQTYRDLLSPRHYMDRHSAIINAKENIAMFGGRARHVGDDHILDAIEDAYESTGANRARNRPAPQTFGKSVESLQDEDLDNDEGMSLEM